MALTFAFCQLLPTVFMCTCMCCFASLDHAPSLIKQILIKDKYRLRPMFGAVIFPVCGLEVMICMADCRSANRPTLVSDFDFCANRLRGQRTMKALSIDSEVFVYVFAMPSSFLALGEVSGAKWRPGAG